MKLEFTATYANGRQLTFPTDTLKVTDYCVHFDHPLDHGTLWLFPDTPTPEGWVPNPMVRLEVTINVPLDKEHYRGRLYDAARDEAMQQVYEDRVHAARLMELQCK